MPSFRKDEGGGGIIWDCGQGEVGGGDYILHELAKTYIFTQVYIYIGIYLFIYIGICIRKGGICIRKGGGIYIGICIHRYT